MIQGTWSRPSLSGMTKFLDATGEEIPLAPGNTWVELAPHDPDHVHLRVMGRIADPRLTDPTGEYVAAQLNRGQSPM